MTAQGESAKFSIFGKVNPLLIGLYTYAAIVLFGIILFFIAYVNYLKDGPLDPPRIDFIFGSIAIKLFFLGILLFGAERIRRRREGYGAALIGLVILSEFPVIDGGLWLVPLFAGVLLLALIDIVLDRRINGLSFWKTFIKIVLIQSFFMLWILTLGFGLFGSMSRGWQSLEIPFFILIPSTFCFYARKSYAASQGERKGWRVLLLFVLDALFCFTLLGAIFAMSFDLSMV